MRLFGAQTAPQALGTWAAMLGPFCLASVLTPIGRWRIVALAGAVTCGLALFGADARTPMVAAAAGLAVVLVLLAVGRSFTGRKALPLIVALMLVVGGGGVFVGTKMADQSSSGARFSKIFDPLTDFSVQDRLVKWRTVLADMDDHPLGHGLGNSGIALMKHGRFTSIARFETDSAYVKIAYDQGYVAMGLFILGVIALVVGLGFRAVRHHDPVRAGVALGAAGAVTAFAVVMVGLTAVEGIGAVAPWLLAGLGFAITGPDEPGEGEDAPA